MSVSVLRAAHLLPRQIQAQQRMCDKPTDVSDEGCLHSSSLNFTTAGLSWVFDKNGLFISDSKYMYFYTRSRMKPSGAHQ